MNTGCFCPPTSYGRPAVVSATKYRDELVPLVADWSAEAGCSGFVATYAWRVVGPSGQDGLTLPDQRLEGDSARASASLGTGGNVYSVVSVARVQPGPTGYSYPEVLQQAYEVYVRPESSGVDGALGPAAQPDTAGASNVIESALDRLTDAVEGMARKLIRVESKMDSETRERAVLAEQVGNLAIVIVDLHAEMSKFRVIMEEESAARRGIGVTVMEHEAKLAVVRGNGHDRPPR